MLSKIIKYFLENKLVTILVLTGLIAWGIVTTPFGWQTGGLPSGSIPVDVIPDIGDIRQIASATMIEMANTFNPPDETIYMQHCPMADDNKDAETG